QRGHTPSLLDRTSGSIGQIKTSSDEGGGGTPCPETRNSAGDPSRANAMRLVKLVPTGCRGASALGSTRRCVCVVVEDCCESLFGPSHSINLPCALNHIILVRSVGHSSKSGTPAGDGKTDRLNSGISLWRVREEIAGPRAPKNRFRLRWR